MKQCAFCHVYLPDHASFCSRCGKIVSQPVQKQARFDSPSENAAPAPVIPPARNIPRPVILVPIESSEQEEKQEEEERQRRAPGLVLPLLVEQVAHLPAPPQPPVLPGTPALPQAATIPNTPPVPATAGSGSASGPQLHPAPASPVQSAPPPVQTVLPLPGTRVPLPASAAPRPGPPPRSAQPRPRTHHLPHFPGWLAAIAAIVAAIVAIIGTTAVLGSTAFAPGLSLSGGTTVSPGQQLTLQGHNFLPGSTVALSLDHNLSLFLLQRPAHNQIVNRQLSPETTGLALQAFQTEPGDVSVSGNGTFRLLISILPTWTPGRHTIHATETLSHRSASLAFTILASTARATVTPTPTATATSTPTPKPTATATATSAPVEPTSAPTSAPAAPPVLNCASPASLGLGTLSELSSQNASASETLCTSGSGKLTWKASWDHTKAPWLKMAQTSGTVQAPHSVKTTISASATALRAGTYTAIVTFTGVESNTHKNVTVTLTVQAGCVQTAPQSLSFTGVAGVSNPDPQSATLTNCGLTSNWSSALTTGSSWLSLSPGSGTLKGSQTQTIAVNASNLGANLAPGTYTDSIVFTIGSKTSTVDITLTVQAPPPTISVSPTSLNQNNGTCSSSENAYTCTVTITNNSSTQAVEWSFDDNGSGANVEANTTTIAAGSSETVTIVIPASDCGTTTTFTFTTPSNSVNVSWVCSAPS